MDKVYVVLETVEYDDNYNTDFRQQTIYTTKEKAIAYIVQETGQHPDKDDVVRVEDATGYTTDVYSVMEHIVN